jgi:L-threonylcarbamoyladenylate synthase
MSDPGQALHEGEVVILPTDTVYGLCASASAPEPVERLYTLKGRGADQPSALLAADLEALRAWLPELEGRPAAIVKALLPGPYTLVVPNPARRYRWLTGTITDAIGVRVPALPPAAARAVAAVGCVAATSANLPGGPDPRRLDDVPRELLDRVAAVVDAGELPGTPSTVLDLTTAEPRVIREGAVPSAEALARALDARLGAEYDPAV